MPRKKRHLDEVSKENKNVNYLESRYLYEKRQALYIANEEINQVWDASDIADFIKAWNEQWTFEQMADYFGAGRWELILLAVDQLNRGKITGDIQMIRGKNDGI